MYKFYHDGANPHGFRWTKFWMMAKLTAAILLIGILHVSAETKAQRVTINRYEVTLKDVFREIKRQTGYNFLWTAKSVDSERVIDVRLEDTSLHDALAVLLGDLPVTYRIDRKTIMVRERLNEKGDKPIEGIPSGLSGEPAAGLVLAIADLRGKVVDSLGQPLAGASVRVLNAEGKRTTLQTTTGRDGEFALGNVPQGASLEVSYVGYVSRIIAASANMGAIVMAQITSALEEVSINKGYYTESRKLSTGSVVRVTGAQIEQQPVANALAVLAGQVPGMIVTQTNGNPGAGMNIQIRGQNSISQGSTPLFIINGVPYPNDKLNSSVIANDGQSPFNSINPGDIESIEVLKDADATAIYGSRGANGVVLITTKRGKPGKNGVDVSMNTGLGRVRNRLELLNTQEYVALRKEAFANDNREITAITAPDLVLWDTTRYTDWQEYLLGGTAGFTNANASLSGGNAQTQFLLSSNYNREEALYTGNYANNRATANLSVTHATPDDRFNAMANFGFATEKNELPRFNMVQALFLPPNHPVLFDGDGNLNWDENGGSFTNPMNALKKKSYEQQTRFLANLALQYRIYDNLYLKVSGGYNQLQLNQLYAEPLSSMDPNDSRAVSKTKFAYTTSRNWIVEPQLAYDWKHGQGKLSALVGGTLQQDIRNTQETDASDFPNDAVLEAAAFAKSLEMETLFADYRYQAAFGRLNYAYADRYVVNLTARRDGSSRFGPNKRVSNFGAIGAAWVFSEEAWLADQLSWLSFGKIRGSYGVTGNDQVGDYRYLDDYGATTTRYQGQVGYRPSRHFNPDYTWERNRKLDVAAEVRLFNNRLSVEANWYRNRSDNQLISYRLPDHTGFGNILRNFDALVQNAGWEFVLAGSPVMSKRFTWNMSVNLTLARNKLLEFPGLESSSYGRSLVIGRPLGIFRRVNYLGVDPETGLYTFDGTNSEVNPSQIVDQTPNYYGGMNHSFTYKGWNLDLLFQFTKQIAQDPSLRALGTVNNQWRSVYEQRWRGPGHQATVQRAGTTTTVSAPYNTFSVYSDGRYMDASFFRLRNVSLSYTLPDRTVSAMGLQRLKIFAQGRNLFTWTDFTGYDPETGSDVPPLQLTTVGFQLVF